MRIPNIRADFLHFTSKSVEVCPNLPAGESSIIILVNGEDLLDLLHNRTLPYTRGPDERKPPGSPESQVDVLGLLCDTDSASSRLGRLHQTVHGADARKNTNSFAF